MTGKKFFHRKDKRRVFLTGKKFFHHKDKRPVFHDLVYVLSRNYWIFFVTVIFFMAVIPFGTAGLSGDSIFDLEVTHEQMKFRLIHGQALPVVLAGCVGLGMLSGVSLFRFMQDKKETTIFFSLGMTRGQLYKNRCISGVLMLFSGIAIPMAVTMALNMKALGIYQGLIRNTVYLTAGLCVTAFISFFAAVTVSALAGTAAEAVVYWCGVMASPTVLCYGGTLLLKTLFWGNPWGVTTYSETEMVRPDLMTEFSRFNPCTFFYSELELHAQFIRPLSSAVPPEVRAGTLAGWCIAAAVLLLLSILSVKRRPAEIAGISGASRCLSEWLIWITSFLVFTGTYSFLYKFNPGTAWLPGIGGSAAVHLFWRKSFFNGQIAKKRGIASLAVQTAAFILICVGAMNAGAIRVQRFLDQGQIMKARISYVGDPGYLYSAADGSSTGRGYYLTGFLEFDEAADIPEVTEIQKTFLESGKQEFATDEEQFSDTVVPYDIVFEYTDSAGKEHVWYYDRASLTQLEQILYLEDTDSVRSGQQQIFDGTLETSGQTIWANEAYWQGTVYLTDMFCSQTYEIELTEEQRSELLGAIGRDKISEGVQEKYFPGQPAAAVLMFSRNGEYDCQHYAYNLDNSFVYVNEQDVNTYGWLEEHQLLNLVSGLPEIESITLQKFDPYVGINGLKYPMGFYFMSYRADTPDEFLIQKDFGKKYTITEEEQISLLMPQLRNGYYMSAGGYLAAVRVKGTDGYIYLFLPAENVPDFVKG